MTICGDAPIAVTRCNGIVDCVHHGSAVLVDRTERIVWECGNANRGVFERSTTKPFRALALIRTGAADAFGLDDGDIATVAGSHSGSKIHVERVAGILSKANLDPSLLACPKRLPLGADALEELGATGAVLSQLHSDCSGEHAGALLICHFLGYDASRYLAFDHPVQVRFRQLIEEFSGGLQLGQIDVTDCCGMPTSLVPLLTLAIRMLRLTRTARHEHSAARLIRSITENPLLYTGKSRLIGQLIIRSGGAAIGKCGAEGVYVVVWPDLGYAFAVKVSDGNHRAALPVIEAASHFAELPVPGLWDCVNTGEFANVEPI